VIWNEPGGPEHSFRTYVPTTWSGARLPHIWLSDGTPIQDAIGDGYTMVQLGGSKADVSDLARAISAFGAPFTTLAVKGSAARDVYGVDLILLRPDMHVAWRGDSVPDDPEHLAALVTGHLAS
jgi:hypothetical protein